MGGEAKIGGFKYQTAGGSKGVKSAAKGAWRAVDRRANSAVQYVIGGKLTTQGTVALVCYAVMLVTAAVSPVVASQVGFSQGGYAALAAVLVSAAVSVYGINCMVVGGCNRLSWLYVAVLLAWTVSVVSGTAYLRYGAGSDKFTAAGADARLSPDPLADAPLTLVAPGVLRPGQPAVASPDRLAASTNVIYDARPPGAHEGYDVQGKEHDAPAPFVHGEQASAA